MIIARQRQVAKQEPVKKNKKTRKVYIAEKLDSAKDGKLKLI